MVRKWLASKNCLKTLLNVDLINFIPMNFQNILSFRYLVLALNIFFVKDKPPVRLTAKKCSLEPSVKKNFGNFVSCNIKH